MQGRRVVITGVGAHTCFGSGAENLWTNCLAGNTLVQQTPPSWQRLAPTSAPLYIPLHLPDYEKFGLRKPDLIQYDPVTLNMLVACQEALIEAGLEIVKGKRNRKHINDYSADQQGVFIGTGTGGCKTLEDHLRRKNIDEFLSTSLETIQQSTALESQARDKLCQQLRDSYKGLVAFHPMVIPRYMCNAIAAAIGIQYSITGPVGNLTLACASGAAAIGQAFEQIKYGNCAFAIAGGSECFHEGDSVFKGFELSGTLVTSDLPAKSANRPFDEKRSGFMFSQGGAAALILEEYQSAKARGANILAEIKGFAQNFDAYSLVKPEPTAAAIKQLATKIETDSQMPFTEVDYFNTHGTGTLLNDSVEATFAEDVFSSDTAINSSKSILGHTIGAAGALEAVICVKSITHQKLHPSLNIERPIADINFVTEATERSIDSAYSQSLAFGGHNTGLLFTRV